RRVYISRVVGDKVMTSADLARLHKELLEYESIDFISDEMRAVNEDLCAGLVHAAKAGGTITPFYGRNRSMIYGTKHDGTHIVEFRTAAGEALAIRIPRTECAVIRHFQERMPYWLFVPDVP